MTKVILINIQTNKKRISKNLAVPFPPLQLSQQNLNIESFENYKKYFVINHSQNTDNESTYSAIKDYSKDYSSFAWELKLVSKNITISYHGTIYSRNFNVIGMLKDVHSHIYSYQICDNSDNVIKHSDYTCDVNNTTNRNLVPPLRDNPPNKQLNDIKVIVILINIQTNKKRNFSKTLAVPFPPLQLSQQNLNIESFENYKKYFVINHSQNTDSESTYSAIKDYSKDYSSFAWKLKLVSKNITMRYHGTIYASDINVIGILKDVQSHIYSYQISNNVIKYSDYACDVNNTTNRNLAPPLRDNPPNTQLNGIRSLYCCVSNTASR
ncbi:hypothetical protein LUA82_03910 [Neoehrlichia mikurensis]|uniref:Uncharacterized protein n=1 Tax=Neoehrlichia mikurensis TaxID=89586 RepID=A0A9Q9BS14_9RICK|nr:hypothetical protein [Neoehrlichia mikurensis]UTO55302.1 hypothetical protein LUA82_03910 [Neoehrlichia mikurensis]UTO56222.1 hypothetical protein LUA81_03875 [Neoehrlichia mikurensis]